MKNSVILLFFILSSFLNFTWAGAANKSGEHHFTDTLKILTYNVRNCKGLDNATDFQRIADVITRSEADCVALQELDSATQRLNHAVLNELAQRTGMFPVFHGSISFQGGKYGIGILTREKPLKTEAMALPGKEEARSLLIVEMKNYVICCTHLSLTHEDRIKSAKMITERLQKYSKPVFLAGDLNTEPNSEEISHLIKDWNIISNPARLTFPANHPDRCIDYIMIMKSSMPKVKVADSKVVNEPMASDHLPVWVKVILNANR
jgi:endonuclease/exonuclease/phosphatase family metal-dependent hydrolase